MIELRNHPAQARHPRTNEPLFNNDGSPVPLIVDQHGIYLDGVLVGYCGIMPNTAATLIYSLPLDIVEQIKSAITEHVGMPKCVSQPPMVSDVQDLLNQEPPDDE